MPDDDVTTTEPAEDTEVDSPDAGASTTPWSDDLEAAFEDEDLRSKVNEFLGDKVQPYVTRIEQEARPSRDATRLWDQFNDQPVDTFVQVGTELWGKEVADQIVSVLQGESPAPSDEDTDVDVDDEETDDESTQVAFDDLPPEVQNAVAKQQQEDQRKAYYEEIDRVKTDYADKLPKDEEGNPQLNVDIFHPFVLTAQGDFDAAAEAFLSWRDTAKSEFGINIPNADDVDAPPVINSDTKNASGKPPQTEEYESLDDAMDAFFKEQDSPPPTVGTA